MVGHTSCVKMNDLDINPRIINSLKKARLQDYSTVLSLSAPDIQRMTHLSINDIHLLKKTVAHKIHRVPHTTALQLHKKTGPSELRREYLTVGCQHLDSFLRGGILSQTLTEISGESASGKTQLCMQLCLTVQLPKKLGGLEGGAVYICTEDVFPNKRLLQMVAQLKERTDLETVQTTNFTDNIFIEHAAEIDDLWFCLSKKIPVLLRLKKVKLVVIDSIAALFRCEHDSYSLQDRAKLLRNIASQLLKLAVEYNIPVICVNQVSDLISHTDVYNSKRKVIPALGITWANHVNVRLMLMRTNQTVAMEQTNAKADTVGPLQVPVRTMEVLFAPHLPSSLCRFIVDQDGVKGIPS